MWWFNRAGVCVCVHVRVSACIHLCTCLTDVDLRHLLLLQETEADPVLPHPAHPTQDHETIILCSTTHCHSPHTLAACSRVDTADSYTQDTLPSGPVKLGMYGCVCMCVCVCVCVCVCDIPSTFPLGKAS